jgi:hypothetical protein
MILHWTRLKFNEFQNNGELYRHSTEVYFVRKLLCHIHQFSLVSGGKSNSQMINWELHFHTSSQIRSVPVLCVPLSTTQNLHGLTSSQRVK